MINTIHPPLRVYEYNSLSIFLAGTIDMGASVDWQSEAIAYWMPMSSRMQLNVYNPRRVDWDSSWKQEMLDPQFNNQVHWELDMIEHCNAVMLVFLGGSQSPISLLELGLIAASTPGKLVVYCAPDFWRKGNVDIVCDRHNILMADSIEDAAAHALTIAKRSH